MNWFGRNSKTPLSPVKVDADHDAVAGDAPVGRVRAEVAAGVVRDVDLHLLWPLAVHLIDLELGRVDPKLLGQGSRPLVDVGLEQMFLGDGFYRFAHPLRLLVERKAQLAGRESSSSICEQG